MARILPFNQGDRRVNARIDEELLDEERSRRLSEMAADELADLDFERVLENLWRDYYGPGDSKGTVI